MSRISDAWSGAASLDTEFGNARADASDRDAFDAYQDRRAIEGAWSTAFAVQQAACAKQPALSVADLVGDGYLSTRLPAPQCYALSAPDLRWERDELIFSQRRAGALRGAEADRFVADPALGWSDVLDVHDPPMRLASGVPLTSTKAASFMWEKAAVDRGVGVNSAPAASALAPVAAMERDYRALFAATKVGGDAAPHGLRPGAPAR